MAPSASSDLDDSDFKEYNPAPYGGGYDLAQTYGNPLSPSDAICYPRTTSASAIPSGATEESSCGSEALPAYGEDPPFDDAIGSRPEDGMIHDEGSWLYGGWGDYHYPTSPIPDHGYGYGNGNGRTHGCCYEQLFGYGHDYGYGNHLGYGSLREYDKPVEPVADEEEEQGYNYVPYGTIESLPTYDSYMGMGYFAPSAGATFEWPCSPMEDGNGNGDDSVERMLKEPWEETVDYLFGNAAAVDCRYREFTESL